MIMEPVIDPATVGAKLTAAAQETPAARVAEFVLEMTCGQIELLAKGNPVETFGFDLVLGISKVYGALSSLATVLLGLSASTSCSY